MLWEIRKNKTNKNAKINKIFGFGNTAMKLVTGGGKGLFSTVEKSRLQPHHHFLTDDDIPLALWAYSRHLCPINILSRILPFYHQGGEGKFLCSSTPQYVGIKKKKKSQFHNHNAFYFINFRVYVAKARLPDKLWQPNLAGRFLDNLATNPLNLSVIEPSVPLLQTGEACILSIQFFYKNVFSHLRYIFLARVTYK